jgi:hypothetical protein
MITPAPPKVAHADQVPIIGTAVGTEREHLVALGVRLRRVELASAGSRAEWEAEQAVQVRSVVSGKPASGCVDGEFREFLPLLAIGSGQHRGRRP